MTTKEKSIVDRAIADEKVDPANRHSTDPAHAPVSLPSGSIDVAELEQQLKGIDKVKPEDRDQAVAEAVTAAHTPGTEYGPAGGMAGFTPVEVPHDEIEGLTETTLAFDREAADQAEKDAAAVEEDRTAGAEAVSAAPAEPGQAGGTSTK